MLIEVPLNWGVAVYDDSTVETVGDRLLPAEILVRFPGKNQPSLTMRIVVRQGVPVCTELSLKADETTEVRAKDLSLVRIDDWMEYVTAACSESAGSSFVTVPSEPDADALQSVRQAKKAGRTAARRSVTPEILEKVAAIYREHIADRPVQAVMRAFDTSERTAARYVERCRKEGLLPPTEPGRKKA
ncbi:hypothetical protein [Gordonia sp. NPDC003376]